MSVGCHFSLSTSSTPSVCATMGGAQTGCVTLTTSSSASSRGWATSIAFLTRLFTPYSTPSSERHSKRSSPKNVHEMAPCDEGALCFRHAQRPQWISSGYALNSTIILYKMYQAFCFYFLKQYVDTKIVA